MAALLDPSPQDHRHHRASRVVVTIVTLNAAIVKVVAAIANAASQSSIGWSWLPPTRVATLGFEALACLLANTRNSHPPPP